MRPTHGRGRIATDFVTRSALALVLASSLSSGIAEARDSATGTLRHAERPGTSHLRVARDPETGGWTLAPLVADGTALDRAPSPDQQMAVNQSSAGLFQVALPHGGWAMDLQGRFQSYSVVRQDVTGHLHYDCGEDPISLFAWLTSMPEAVDAWGRPVR